MSGTVSDTILLSQCLHSRTACGFGTVSLGSIECQVCMRWCWFSVDIDICGIRVWNDILSKSGFLLVYVRPLSQPFVYVLCSPYWTIISCTTALCTEERDGGENKLLSIEGEKQNWRERRNKRRRYHEDEEPVARAGVRVETSAVVRKTKIAGCDKGRKKSWGVCCSHP